MNSYEMDVLFHMASFGKKEDLDRLYEAYVKVVRKEIKFALSKYRNTFITEYDFPELEYDMFLSFIKTFDPTKSRAISYINFLLSKKINSMINEKIFNLEERPLSLDQSLDENPLYDYIEDKTIVPIPNQVSIDRFKYEISSPKNNKRKSKLKSKSFNMLLEGYSKEDIAKKLNLTRSQVKTLTKIDENDIDLQNLKLELK